MKLLSKPRTIGRVTFHPGRNRSRADHMGRFGGGWQWKVGITAGDRSRRHGQTIMVALLTDEYRIQIAPKPAAQSHAKSV